MAHVSPALSRGIHVLSDADRLRMPGHDTRFAAGVMPADHRVRWGRPRARIRPRAWLAAVRRPAARVSHQASTS